MEVQPGNSSDDEKQRQQQPNFEKIKSLYSNYLSAIFHSLNSNFIHKLSSFFRPSSPRRRKPSLPLPLPFESVHFNPSSFSPSKMFDVLENILEHVLLNLHVIQKNLLFWETRAEGSAARKAYFMLFERGPRALIGETFRTVKECGAEGSWTDSLSDSAYIHIAERITFFNKLRHCLATFLAQVYMEVDKFGGELIKEPEKTLPLLLTRVNDLFSKLETSIQNVQTMHWKDSSADGSSTPLLFEKLPEVNQEGSQWTESEVRDAINLIYRNLQKLDSHLSFLIAKHKKPNKVTLYWIHYTLGIAGVSFCSMWLIRHSRLAGSSDIDNWICDAKDSTVSFWNDHVEQPIISIRDELFNTFRKRHKGVMEFEEVQLTATSLHRMLLAFSQKTGGQNIPENTPDQEMLEIVMARYEKELMHPIQNLVAGELARALLIQIQKLKLDIETAMLELDQILKANEINFAVLAALPAFFLSLGLIMGVRTWLRKDTKAEGRGRIARLQRRLLLVDVEKGLMKYQLFLDQGLEKDAECMFGLMLYSLDRLYRAVEGNAKATGEWLSLSQDIMELGKPDLSTPYKMAVTSRMERLYDCLLPSLMHK